MGDFLRSRRARIQPEDAGFASGSGVRRVPGLRREELAHLAGVSVDYYVRLEQGRNLSVSDAVLGAVADALRMDRDERDHLFRLAILVTVGSATAATATSYFATYRVDGWTDGMVSPRLPANVGHYEDTFRKVEGAWFLSSQVTHLPFGGETARLSAR